MMKTIRYTGLFIFIIAFGLFNYLFFIESYELKPQFTSQFIPDDHRSEWFQHESSSFYGRTFSSNFEFISALDIAFENANQSIRKIYEINEEELAMLLNAGNQEYSEEISLRIFKSGSDADQFKIKTINDYSSWLYGRTYDEELEIALSHTVRNINTYEVISKKGFDRYLIKNLKYELTKASSKGPVSSNPLLFLILTIGGAFLGGLMYVLPAIKTTLPSIQNNGIFKNSMTSRGWLGILTGSYLIVFYFILYFFHPYMTTWIIMADPVSYFLKNAPGGQFFLYGMMYTLVILVMGIRMLIKYRHSNYQLLRTLSVMFFQTAFAFLIPEILMRLNQPYFDFKNIWPLDYDFFFDYNLETLLNNGTLGIFMLFWGIILIIIIVPVMVYFFGKRWYCSWVCGCGGLAETLGDPYRQLSDKSLKAWKFERYSINTVLVFSVVMTIAVLYTFFTGSGSILGINSYTLREIYGVYIGAWFAGVVGTGFYPLMGNRVWCRYGCPLAAYMGIIQRFKSRFRITTNGGQCISCGNCSTYCEMGIDVRWYAQREQDIVRSSCVGCGVCEEVCPRGVLRLENSKEVRVLKEK